MRNLAQDLPRLTVAPAPPRQASPPQRNAARRAPAARRWLGLLRRREPSTFERCLAVHIHFAGPRSALS